MIARLHVLLPVWLTVRQGEEFTVYQYEDNGYKVRVFPPARSDQLTRRTGFTKSRLMARQLYE